MGSDALTLSRFGSSMPTEATLISGWFLAILMIVGIMVRHGGQLVLEISKRTVFEDLRTSCSKLESLIFTILMSSVRGAAMAGTALTASANTAEPIIE